MAFRDHPGFTVKSDPRIRRPDGGKKKKQGQKASRHSIATSGGYNEAIIWLRGR